MGQVQRGSCRFYVRSVRRNGRVTSEYLGSGEMGRSLAHLHALDVAERREQQEQRRAERAELIDRDQAEAERFRAVSAMVRDGLAELGFHRVNRCRWRRRKGMAANTSTPATVDRPRSPIGDLGKLYEMCEISHMFHEDREQMRAIHAEVARMRAELEPPGTPAIERMLAERVIHCWLDLYQWELQSTPKQASIEYLVTISRLRDKAHARYIKAIKTLAQIKVLDLRGAETRAELLAAFARKGRPAAALDGTQASLPNQHEPASTPDG